MNKLMIYMAEDDLSDSNLVKKNFKKNGQQDSLQILGDGAQLIDHIEKNGPPDCLLLDMNMPLVDGFGVLKYLEENDLKNFPVYVMSSSQMHIEILKKRGCKPSGFLMKPVSYVDVKNELDKSKDREL